MKIFGFFWRYSNLVKLTIYINGLLLGNMKPPLSIVLLCFGFLAASQNYQHFNVDTHKVFKTHYELAKTFSLVFDSVYVDATGVV